MTQEFVTLPREVVEQAMEALINEDEFRKLLEPLIEKSIDSIRAALEQPQAEQPAMTPIAQRKLDSLLTEGYTISGYSVYHEQKHQHGFVTGAGLVGWWKPEGMEYPQPQGERGPVAWIRTEWSSRNVTFDGPPAVPSVRDELTKPVWTPLYTHPQPRREPLSTARIDELIEEGIFGGNPYELVRRLEEERGVFMTRPLTDEQINRIIADLAPVFLDTPTGFEEDFCRAIEAAHNIK